jgi:hypothetical protein
MALTTPNAPRLRIYLRTFIDLTDGVWPSPNGLPQGHTVDSWVRNYMDTGFGDVLLAEALGAPRGHLSGLIDRVEFVEDSAAATPNLITRVDGTVVDPDASRD